MNRNRKLSILMTIVGAIFSVYGIALCIATNINTGVVLVLLLGLFMLAAGIFYKQLAQLTKSGFFRICKIIVIIGLCVELILVSFLAIYGVTDTVDYREDAVVVLGAGIKGDKVTVTLKHRLDKAIEYHSKNPDAIIIVTGGQGFQETVTEAYAMEKYLVEAGVDKSKIIKEEKATSTAENMRFSKEILDGHFDKDYSVAVITNNFHIFRAVTIAGRNGLEHVSHLHAGLQWYNVIPSYLRESIAILKMIIMD